MGIPGSKWWAGKREGTGAPFGWRAPRTMFVLLWWVNLFGPALAQPPASRLLLKILKGQTGRVRKLAFGIDLVTVYVFVPPSTQYDRVRKLYFCVDLPQNPPVRKIFVPVRTGTKTCIWHRPCHNLRVRTAFHTIRSCTKNVFLRRPSRDFTGTKIFVPVRK